MVIASKGLKQGIKKRRCKGIEVFIFLGMRREDIREGVIWCL
jgi:hypothetical protein